MERAYVALGSNLGDRDAHLAYARRRLGALAHTRLLAASAVEETAPIGPVAQPPYLNQMVLLETALAPAALLAECRAIEVQRARGRRPLDSDTVRRGNPGVREPDLVIPHPELPNREFWQREIAELDKEAAE